MIKYIEFNSIDDNGEQRIHTIDQVMSLNKTASAGNYAPDILNYIQGMKKREDRYYIVINALGSYESWGRNSRGDVFPRKDLSHVSLRSDMGTPNDYGYKTFEYYAKLFKHHANKPHHPSYGEVLFAHFNAGMDRVELIVAVDLDTGGDIVEALENGEDVAVSMGAKVPFDECSICHKKAKTRKEYCKHLKHHLGKLVTPSLSEKWSKELGYHIPIGKDIVALNTRPRFFDISRVTRGADKVSYILGKAASDNNVISGVDLADAYGITDNYFDKIAEMGKRGEMSKKIPGDENTVDGKVVIPKQIKDRVKNNIDIEVDKSIGNEPEINSNKLNYLASNFPFKNILSTMLGLGIHPKPKEFQRIVLVSIGEPEMANRFEKHNLIFNEDMADNEIPFNIESINDLIAGNLKDVMESRSSCPNFIVKRLNTPLILKTAAYSSVEGNDYWERQPQNMVNVGPNIPVLSAIAALFMGLKHTANKRSIRDIHKTVNDSHVARSLIGGGVLAKLNHDIANQNIDNRVLAIPAQHYEDVLDSMPYIPGLEKQAGIPQQAAGNALLAAGVLLPASHIINSYNKKHQYYKGYSAFPGANAFNPKITPIVGAGGAAALPVVRSKISKLLS